MAVLQPLGFSMGVVTAHQLLGWWRFAVVVAAVVAAFITPTVDPFNMMLVMGPLVALYFLSVGLAKLARPTKRAAKQAAKQATSSGK